MNGFDKDQINGTGVENDQMMNTNETYGRADKGKLNAKIWEQDREHVALSDEAPHWTEDEGRIGQTP